MGAVAAATGVLTVSEDGLAVAAGVAASAMAFSEDELTGAAGVVEDAGLGTWSIRSGTAQILSGMDLTV